MRKRKFLQLLSESDSQAATEDCLYVALLGTALLIVWLPGTLATVTLDMSPLLSEIPSIHAQQCANHRR